MTSPDLNSKLSPMRASNRVARVEWVDIVKGMSIFLVVMMHSTLGVQNAVGETSWMGAIVEFARPFRIPCFMLVSGLFLHKAINGDWPRFLDRKVLHFVYFYVLWVAIQVLVKTPAWMGEGQSGLDIVQLYLTTFVQPFGTLWFIYLLPVFYLVTRLLRNVDWRIVFGAAILLQLLPIQTGSTLIDEFASRFVYFYSGYVLYQRFFAWAEFAAKHVVSFSIFLGLWFLLNMAMTANGVPQFLVQMVPSAEKIADLPLISLGLGFAGTMAMIGLGSVILRVKWLSFMQWIGEHSIVIYLAFFLPMGVVRVVLLKFADGFLSTGAIAAIVTLSAFIAPMVFYWLVKKTRLGLFLIERPGWARREPATHLKTSALHPAE